MNYSDITDINKTYDDSFADRKLTDTRKPTLTLKNLNKLRKMREMRKFEKIKQEDFFEILYGSPAQM